MNNRGGRRPISKSFVSGGFNNSPANGNYQQQNQGNFGQKSPVQQQKTSPVSTRQQQPQQQLKATQPQQQPKPVQAPQQQPNPVQAPQQQPKPVPAPQQQPKPQQQLQTQEEPSALEEEVKLEEDQPMESEDGEAVENGEFISKGRLQFKKIFLTRKKNSVRTKEKRIRQNRRLRKSILPKNALMALNEVKGITISDFIINSNPGSGFTAFVTVNGTQYDGKGNSKVAAKNTACEKALRDYVIEKMRQKPRLAKAQQGSVEKMDQDANESDSAETQKSTSDDIDDVPMVNLASFALYKLFSGWENEGFIVPEMHPITPATNGAEDEIAAPKEPKKATIRTELPPNWETMHPATLLCMMRPGLSYNELGAINKDENITLQKVSVVVDDQEFFGVGRSKKLARRNAAVDATNTLFNTNFLKEEPSA